MEDLIVQSVTETNEVQKYEDIKVLCQYSNRWIPCQALTTRVQHTEFHPDHSSRIVHSEYSGEVEQCSDDLFSVIAKAFNEERSVSVEINGAFWMSRVISGDKANKSCSLAFLRMEPYH